MIMSAGHFCNKIREATDIIVTHLVKHENYKNGQPLVQLQIRNERNKTSGL